MKKIKKWFNETALPWLKKSWMRIIDLILFMFIYNAFAKAEMTGWETLVGFWIFVLLAYYIFWEFFGMGKVVKKLIKEKKK